MPGLAQQALRARVAAARETEAEWEARMDTEARALERAMARLAGMPRQVGVDRQTAEQLAALPAQVVEEALRANGGHVERTIDALRADVRRAQEWEANVQRRERQEEQRRLGLQELNRLGRGQRDAEQSQRREREEAARVQLARSVIFSNVC